MSNEIHSINPSQAAHRAADAGSSETRRADVRLQGGAGGRQVSAENRQLPGAPGTSEASSRPTSQGLSAVVDLKSEVQRIFRDIDLSVDPDLDDVVVRIVDRETGELVRQIPSEELLELARNLHELREQTAAESFASGDGSGQSRPSAREGLLIHIKA